MVQGVGVAFIDSFFSESRPPLADTHTEHGENAFNSLHD